MSKKSCMVAQVRVSAGEYSFHSAYLGVNARLELKIDYCDELGFKVAEANGVVPLDVEINYPNVLSIKMSDAGSITSAEKIILEAKGPGRALARISISHNPNKADFILVLVIIVILLQLVEFCSDHEVSVGAQLYPQNPVLNVGHAINFSVIADG
ncbi:hypothetical protein M5K25_011155 [Dendrobium thyrsiflorum]|uniref:Uncharacterized protein n=1 Tax=Dendrobium thyrsiflorum TaxID=117978 RepID=A0ABD0V1Y1_DENTH